LWNALPGIEKRKKVGDCDALIDQLWAAIEASPEPEPQADAKRPSKQEKVMRCCGDPKAQRSTRWCAPRAGSATPCAASSVNSKKSLISGPSLLQR
jgi:hypothetical protein